MRVIRTDPAVRLIRAASAITGRSVVTLDEIVSVTGELPVLAEIDLDDAEERGHVVATDDGYAVADGYQSVEVCGRCGRPASACPETMTTLEHEEALQRLHAASERA